MLAVGKRVRARPLGLFSSFLTPAHSFWLVLAVDKRVRPGPAREAKLLWLAAPSGPTALLLFEQAAGALLWFVPGMANGARRRRAWAWTGRGLNPAPLACGAGVMPLHQLPLSSGGRACSTTCSAQLFALKTHFFFLSAPGRAQFSGLKLCHGPPVRPFFVLSAFLLPAHSFCYFPFPFCCRRAPLVGARCGQTSAARKSAGSEAFVAGRSLWTHSLAAIGLSRDVRHPAAAEQAAGALLLFVLAAAKRVRPPSALDAKLFLLLAPWGPVAFYLLYRILQ